MCLWNSVLSQLCLICFCIMLCLTVCRFYIGILFLKKCEKYKIQNPSRVTLVDIENYTVKMYLYFSIQIFYWIKCIISLYNSQWGVFIVSIYIVHEKHHNFATQKVTLATDRSLKPCVFFNNVDWFFHSRLNNKSLSDDMFPLYC